MANFATEERAAQVDPQDLVELLDVPLVHVAPSRTRRCPALLTSGVEAAERRRPRGDDRPAPLDLRHVAQRFDGRRRRRRWISSTVRLDRAPRRGRRTATRAPSRAKRLATSRPIPLDAPVTSARFPSRRPISLLLPGRVVGTRRRERPRHRRRRSLLRLRTRPGRRGGMPPPPPSPPAGPRGASGPAGLRGATPPRDRGRGGSVAYVIGVSMHPGSRALQRIPNAP